MSDDPHDPTPRLSEFREMEAHDPNAFWRLSCGDHQNLLDEAIDKLAETFDAGVKEGWETSGDTGINAAIYEYGDPHVDWPDNPYKEGA